MSAPHDSRRRDIEWDCAQCLLRFYRRFDYGDYAGMAALFVEDGEWHRAGKVLSGRQAIVAELQKRPVDQKVLHLPTNIVVEVQDDRHAEAWAYLTVYRGQVGSPQSPSAVPTIRGPDLVLSVRATLELAGAVWSIRRQVMTREFAFAAG